MTAPLTLSHGERFGSLRVLERIKIKHSKWRYRVGCECGNSREMYRARQLTSGRVTQCRLCTQGCANQV